MTVNSVPQTITGSTYAQFQANVAALMATGTGIGYGWNAITPLTQQNGIYYQTFRQYFPLQQWNNAPSVYNSWVTRIPRVYSPWPRPNL